MEKLFFLGINLAHLYADAALLFLALAHHSVNRQVSPCCTGETCFWSVTHAACWTMWNHSSVSSCQSAKGPAILSERALQAVSMLSQRANLQTAAFSIRSGFWRCGYFFFSYIFRGMGEAGLQLNVQCALYAAVQFVHRFMCNKVMNHTHWDLLPVETPWRRSPWRAGAKPIRWFS